jgi:antitoxin YefM
LIYILELFGIDFINPPLRTRTGEYVGGGSIRSYLWSIAFKCYTCTNNCTSISCMKVVSFSEARSSLKTVLDRVVEDADYTIVTRRDADDVVVMSLESFNSLMETVHLLKSPANAAHLERSIAQFRAGKAVERDLQG